MTHSPADCLVTATIYGAKANRTLHSLLRFPNTSGTCLFPWPRCRACAHFRRAALRTGSDGSVLWRQAAAPSAAASSAAGYPAGTARSHVAATASLTSAKLWSAEEPNLYLVTLELSRGGEVVGVESTRLGLRTVKARSLSGGGAGARINSSRCRETAEKMITVFRSLVARQVEDKRLLVNGKPVLLAGVNRHEHDPVTGKVRGEGGVFGAPRRAGAQMGWCDCLKSLTAEAILCPCAATPQHRRSRRSPWWTTSSS